MTSGRASAGYAIHDGVLDAATLAVIVEALASAGLSGTRAGARHLLRIPAVEALARDGRVLTESWRCGR